MEAPSMTYEQRVMENYDREPEQAELLPTIKEIEVRLRKLGCTREQVRHHVDQVTVGRQIPERPKRKHRKR
jgi:hypothetical protein